MDHNNTAVAIIVLFAILTLSFSSYLLMQRTNTESEGYWVACSKPYALYGIPMQYKYLSYANSTDSIDPNGSISSISCYYSLGIMYYVFNGSEEANMTHYLSVPINYSGYSYPTGVNINLAEFKNDSELTAFAKKFYGDSNITEYLAAGIAPTGAKTIETHFTSNTTYIKGINVSVIRFYPIYQNYEEYQLAFSEGNYFVIINEYGINGSFLPSFSKSLLLHDYGMLLNFTACSSKSCL